MWGGGAGSTPEKANVSSLEWVLERMTEKPETEPSQAVKEQEDVLRKDVDSLEAIFKLGRLCAEIGYWEKCSGVLLRGWQRVGEIEDKDTRFRFLLLIVLALVQEGGRNNNRLATRILEDLRFGDPSVKSFQLLRCRVSCGKDDFGARARAVTAFHLALEGADFELAYRAWSCCVDGLARVGAFEETRETLARLAARLVDPTQRRSAEERVRLTAEEKGPEVLHEWKKYAVIACSLVAWCVLWSSRPGLAMPAMADSCRVALLGVASEALARRLMEVPLLDKTELYQAQVLSGIFWRGPLRYALWCWVEWLFRRKRQKARGTLVLKLLVHTSVGDSIYVVCYMYLLGFMVGRPHYKLKKNLEEGAAEALSLHFRVWPVARIVMGFFVAYLPGFLLPDVWVVALESAAGFFADALVTWQTRV